MARAAVLKNMIRTALCFAVAALLASSGAAAASATPRWVKAAKQQLATLSVKAPASMQGYSRDKFGTPWADVDDNGCGTRDDILARDLRHLSFKKIGACARVVARGVLHDPYTGKTIAFVRGVKTSSAVQIDHVVALGDAWRTGAAKWAARVRLAYANDPVVLLAVDGPANGAKSDSDAAGWLPPQHAYECRYVARQIAIKAKYRLWVTSAERAAMSALLATC
jgi:hypothetical protein